MTRRVATVSGCLGFLLGVASVGCGSTDAPANKAAVCAPGATGCAPTTTTAGSGGMGASGSLGVAGNSTGLGGSGVVAASGSGGQSAPAGGLGVPCEVAAIVGTSCTGCHNPDKQFAAPMPLMSLLDFQAMAPITKTQHVFEAAQGRINSTDTKLRMPPVGTVDALTDTQKQTLTTWLSGGAIGVANSCEIKRANLIPGGAPDGGVVSMGNSGGASIDPITYDDPEMKCYKFLTHASGDMNAPYSQGPGEQYIAFTFKAPWTGTVYMRATKIVIDPASKVLHHWLMFQQSTAVTDGAVAPGNGTHPDGILLYGWAPGATPLYLDPDVGIELPGDVGYEIEAHFNNSGLTPGDDHSGAELCVTPKKPEHVAELAWVGSDSIIGTSATGLCAPNNTEPIHLIAAQPHMHLKGVHMKETINRADGTSTVIHDDDFSFENQRYYILHDMLMPGDTMTTECTYNAPATFGSSTSNEMCYFFTLHWPAGALRSAGIGTVLHGQDSCL